MGKVGGSAFVGWDADILRILRILLERVGTLMQCDMPSFAGDGSGGLGCVGLGWALCRMALREVGSASDEEMMKTCCTDGDRHTQFEL